MLNYIFNPPKSPFSKGGLPEIRFDTREGLSLLKERFGADCKVFENNTGKDHASYDS